MNICPIELKRAKEGFKIFQIQKNFLQIAQDV